MRITKKTYPTRYRDFGWIPVDRGNYITRESRTIDRTKIAEDVESRCTTTSLKHGWWVYDKLRHAILNAPEQLALVEFTRYCGDPAEKGHAQFTDERTIDLKPLYIFPAGEIRTRYFRLLAENLIIEHKTKLKPEIQYYIDGNKTDRHILNQPWYTTVEQDYELTRVMRAAISVCHPAVYVYTHANSYNILTFSYATQRGDQQEEQYVLARVLSQVLDETMLHKPMLLDVLCNRYTHASTQCETQPQRAWRDLL